MHLLAEGKYATAVVKKGLRGVTDTVITSIPHFSFQSSLQDGYFKYASLPQAIDKISFTMNATCPDNNYKHTTLSIDNINASVLSSYIKGFFKLYNLNDLNMEGRLQSVFHLSDLAQVYPMDSLTLKGDLAMDLDTKGRYLPERRIFPVAKANLRLQNGFIQTKYYPDPVENIQVTADITNTAGNFRTLKVDLSPVSFRFAQQPFLLKADLSNFDNLKYDIVSKGTLDLGKIYRVFAVKGYDLKGFIKANISLHGLQSDATAGRFDRLANSGTLQVQNIALQSELFPQPLWVTNGLFRFDQDKMWFDAFQGKYGSAALTLNGHLSNVMAYATQKDAPLKGNFELNSDYIKVDELMAFAPVQSNTGTSNIPTGVILIPANLDLQLAANVKTLKYQGLLISNASAAVRVDSGSIALQKAGFEVAGCKVNMDALYKSITPLKASFDYHINAADFDVKRMYKEVELFRNMVTAAAKAEGIISLDYQLSGKLDANMKPVYPSLKGGGVLTVQKVKMRGFKLFNAMSSATGKDGVKDPDLSKIEIKSTIANNLITLERTKMKVSGFRPRFEGQVSFDGKLNLSGRLGLPPLGILGIPFSVTGTQENPKIKLRRSKESDKLEETTEEGDKD
jgi:AsmA protein